jgi:membrane-associated protease RseP (regulator of RpoE activity)
VILLEMLGWVIFLLGVGFSIGMHEIGHLLPAKAFGVKVTQYMVGFGPTAWSRRKGETEYGVKWIPLGGYIRMIGMYPPEKGADPTMLRASSTGRWSTLINDARQASLEEVKPEDADRVFYKLPVRKRIVVMLGGPVMNLVLALFMFTIVISGIGLQTDLQGNPNLTNSVGVVVQCLPTQDNPQGTAAPNGECTGSTPTPAYAGGLQRGDIILSVAGTPTASWADVQAAIKAAPTGDVVVVVDRAGEQVVLTVPLAAIERPVLDADGNPTGETEERNFLGISPAVERVTQPVTAVPGYVWDLSVRAIGTIVTLPVRLWDLAVSTFTDAPRDEEGIVGPVGVGRITGEIVALEETPVIDKVAGVLSLLAGLNLFLFLFNLIPLLPLDGGHVAGAIWESIKRGWAKLRHKPDPGPVDIAKALPVTYVISFFLVGMGALVLLADLIEPISLRG